MKTQRNILIAFILNLSFALFEMFGGLFTGSVAIISDSVHDAGDALSIGISYFLERKSNRQPDDKYTYGYLRFSVMGSVITTLILLCGSALVIVSSVERLINPTEINYNGMIFIAIFSIIVNSLAAFVTHGGGSLNQKAVNLHMLEDVLGWVVVLVGAVLMKFTDLSVIDPLMSIGVSLFILINALKNLMSVIDIFLERVPRDLNVENVRNGICGVEGVEDAHHIHIRSMDGVNNYATMHIVTDTDPCEIKRKVRTELLKYGISHATIETERSCEHCDSVCCQIRQNEEQHHHHHHHHH